MAMLADLRISHIRALSQYWGSALNRRPLAAGEVVKSFNSIALSPAFEPTLAPAVEPVIALPRKLLEAIKSEIPDFFLVDEWEAENEFTRLCDRMKAIGARNTGFLHHPFLGPASARIVFSAEDIQAAGWGELTNQTDLEKAMQFVDGVSEQIRERREGYLGWLLTCPRFLSELDMLRKEETKNSSSCSQPNATAETQPGSESPTSAAMEMRSAFLRRWDLASLETWDLPVPTMPSFGAIAPPAASGLVDSPAVQVPKTLQLADRFPVDVFLQAKQEEHLEEWFAISERAHRGQLGYVGFRWILKIHFWRNKVLAPSYGERFRRRTEKLDYAFAAYLGDLSVESVRKHRQRIERRLKS
jgi:hypothetical protein